MRSDHLPLPTTGGDNFILTVKEWNQVEKFAVLGVTLELRNDYAVVWLVRHLIILEVNVDHIFQRSVQVRQVLDIGSILRYGRALSTKGAPEYLMVRVQTLAHFLHLVGVRHTEYAHLVVLANLVQKCSKPRPLIKLTASAHLVDLVYKSALESKNQRLLRLHPGRHVGQHLRHGWLREDLLDVEDRVVHVPGRSQK